MNTSYRMRLARNAEDPQTATLPGGGRITLSGELQRKKRSICHGTADKPGRPFTRRWKVVLLGTCVAALTLIGCAHSAGGEPGPAKRPVAPETKPPAAQAPAPAATPPESPGGEQAGSLADLFPWMKPPAPIAGRWKLADNALCKRVKQVVVEIVVTPDDPKTATGRIVGLKASTSREYGFRRGEEVMQLRADDYGNWRGKVKWRSVTRAQRWDPVYFVLDGGKLSGTMSTDDCWKGMMRVQ